jgi:hypothetical protein
VNDDREGFCTDVLVRSPCAERSKKSLQQDRKLTHTDHKEFIAILDEPLKQAIYGKGAIPSAATEAIRHLACTFPLLR